MNCRQCKQSFAGTAAAGVGAVQASYLMPLSLVLVQQKDHATIRELIL